MVVPISSKMSVASHREYIHTISLDTFKSLIYLLKSSSFGQTTKKGSDIELYLRDHDC